MKWRSWFRLSDNLKHKKQSFADINDQIEDGDDDDEAFKRDVKWENFEYVLTYGAIKSRERERLKKMKW